VTRYSRPRMMVRTVMAMLPAWRPEAATAGTHNQAAAPAATATRGASSKGSTRGYPSTRGSSLCPSLPLPSVCPAPPPPPCLRLLYLPTPCHCPCPQPPWGDPSLTVYPAGRAWLPMMASTLEVNTHSPAAIPPACTAPLEERGEGGGGGVRLERDAASAGGLHVMQPQAGLPEQAGGGSM
jgi:hypothetical protein